MSWCVADWAPDRVDEHYRKDLAGQLGNLLARISTPKLWSRFPPELRSGTSLFYPPSSPTSASEDNKQLAARISDLPGTSLFVQSLSAGFDVADCCAKRSAEFERLMTAFEIPRALKAIFDVLADVSYHLPLSSKD